MTGRQLDQWQMARGREGEIDDGKKTQKRMSKRQREKGRRSYPATQQKSKITNSKCKMWPDILVYQPKYAFCLAAS